MWNSERFFSTDDRIRLRLKGYCPEGHWIFYGYDKNGAQKILHRELISGDFDISYETDPVGLGVYEGAVSFSVTVTGECRVDEWGVTVPETSVRANDSVSVVRDGTVPVLRTDGTEIRVSIDPKKVLFIGNSLLLGMYDTYGMCSTAPDKDYTYLVSRAILKRSPDCTFTKLRGNFVEQSQSVEEYEEKLFRETDPRFGHAPIECFTKELDLITVQLMDNVNTPEKVAAFKQTLPLFLEEVKRRCPKARIVWIYGWYMKPDVLPTLLDACKQWKIETLDISPAHTKENEATSGQLSYHPDGEMIAVPDLWISHPGDGGMRAIADMLIEKLFD